MKRITKIFGCVTAFVLSGATYGQKEIDGLRTVFEDPSAVLQAWSGPQKEQEYLLTGRKPGLNVGLTFSHDTASEAKIGLSPGRSLSAQSVGDRVVISLFEGSGKEISVTYDLDANGTWDARIARSGKCEIWSASGWRQVGRFSELIAGTPHATSEGVEYQFLGGEWSPVKK